MTSPDTARLVEQDLLAKADVLAHYLRGLAATDPDLAAEILTEIAARLEGALLPNGAAKAGKRGAALERRQPALVASRSPSDELEEFILESLTDSPRGLSVQEIVDRLDEAKIEIKRQTLVVRLHRMVQAGKLASRAHGHYTLSEGEDGRRRGA
jgi:DNA-binding transcriptional regulator PaaX